MAKHGINSYDEKQRRRIRRQNHIARDLAKTKYHQRVIPNKDHDYTIINEEDFEE